MKKLLFLGILFMAANAHAMSNRDDFQRWRATDTATADGYVFISSGCPCVIWDLTVTSGAFNPGQASFQYHGSTATGPNLARNISVSSSPVFDIDNTGDTFMIGDVVTSSSVYYSKTGPSTIRLRWDYFTSPPKGLERKGLKP